MISELTNFERKLFLATIIILALFLIILGFNQLIGAINDYRNGGVTNISPTVSFIGEGKVKATPDTAKVDIGLISEGKDSISVQNENSDRMNKVIDYLKKEGISADDIKTSNYNLSPKYEYSKGKSTLAGYILNQTLTVTIRDLNKVGEILDGSVNSGANQINSVSLFIDKPEELKNKAREEAVKQAKEKAAVVSKIAGFRLGRLVNFSESTLGEPPVYRAMEMAGGGAAAAAPQIEPGSQEIIIDITLTYLIR